MFFRRATLILTATLLATAAFAQRRPIADTRSVVNLDTLAHRPESHQPIAGPRREVFDPGLELRGHNTRDASIGLPRESVPPPASANVTPAYSGFQALLDNFSTIPPDTNGAVSPQYLVTMLNTQMVIQSRDGAFRPNYPINLGGRYGFWSSLTTSIDVFDPNIAYDAASDRWIASAAVDSGKSTSALLVGVSQSGDPGGTWSLYKVSIGANGNWGDYPTLGFNGRWIVVSLNLFTNKNNNYVTTTLYVFSKSDLYQNSKGAYVTFTDPNGEFTPVADYDNQPGTLYMVRTFAGDAGINNNVGTIEISELQGTVGAETFSAGNGGQLVFNDPWSDTGADGADFAPQLGSTRKIDTGDSRMQNCVLRGGTIWCAHTIFLPFLSPRRSAVQWFQVDPAARRILQRGRIDDPTNANFYAYPSIAVNRNNDALVGYNRFTATDYPAAEFSFRLATDPASTMEPDVVFKPGEATYVAPGARTGSNRWGDFSRTWVDPVDDLAFWTIQEYAASPCCGYTGEFATWWTKVAAPSSTQAQAPAISAPGISNAASYLGGGIAPGELITIFGNNLGPSTVQKPPVSPTGAVGTVAGGTQVLFDGVAAPMVFTSQMQVAAVAPFSLQSKTTTHVQVVYQGAASNLLTIPIVQAAPGIFAANASGQGTGAIANQDGTSNSPSNPAARGSYITIYATGGGAMTGAADGILAPNPPPYVQVNQTPTATIGGQPAQVTYAGLAPGIIVGVVQFNVIVPQTLTPGSAVPLTIAVGGIASPSGITVAIK